jgi:hypothetical protein
MRPKELYVELRDRIVSRHRSGKGSPKMFAALKLQEQWPPFLNEEVWNYRDAF